jgi:putative transcriptional regulator
MSQVGNLLIAPPAVKNSFWQKSVVMITEDHAQGTVGVIINKRSNMSVVEFANQLGFSVDLPGFVYIGGPVNSKNLSFLHTNDWVCNNTLRINDTFSLSSSHDMIPRLAAGDLPERWRIILGVAGWAPGQLNSELEGIAPFKHENSWCVTKSNIDLVFGDDNNAQWCNAIDRSAQEFAANLLT